MGRRWHQQQHRSRTSLWSYRHHLAFHAKNGRFWRCLEAVKRGFHDIGWAPSPSSRLEDHELDRLGAGRRQHSTRTRRPRSSDLRRQLVRVWRHRHRPDRAPRGPVAVRPGPGGVGATVRARPDGEQRRPGPVRTRWHGCLPPGRTAGDVWGAGRVADAERYLGLRSGRGGGLGRRRPGRSLELSPRLPLAGVPRGLPVVLWGLGARVQRWQSVLSLCLQQPACPHWPERRAVAAAC
mmetsp:Transcript_6619/g.10522  ORF Transcript_6619/g.10522 Transcript_6619/m.10522 type:complete len:237 (-) Transcript_6619:762-1472(-)